MRKSFILAACESAPMIVSRLDWQREAGSNDVGGVGAQILEDRYEPKETDLLLKLVVARRQLYGAGVFVIDCGAHVGAFTVPLAQAMEGWGHVLAIEAQERMFYALCGNLALNNLWNARALWGAVAERDGYLEGPIVDYTTPTNFGGISMIPRHNKDCAQPISYGHTIPAYRLDSFEFMRLDVIKIDVEGMERQVLSGARMMIRRFKPAMVIEWIKVDGGIAAIQEEIPDYRLEPFGIDMVCLHRDDPLWKNFNIKEVA